MFTILVSGAASGLGYAFVVAFARKYPNSIIYAVDRAPIPPSLAEINHPQTKYHQLDITKEEEIVQFGWELNTNKVAIDLVVHSAGVRGLVPSVPIQHSNDVARAETLEVMDVQTMSLAFEVNALGFLLLMKSLTPALRRAAAMARSREGRDLSNSAEQSIELTKTVVIGSRMGSIGHNTTIGGGYAYRASKAALNAIVKSLSIDVPEVIWTVVHPGRVETGLVAVKEEGAMTIDESLGDLIPLIERLGRKVSGTFIDRFGVAVPW